MLMRSQTTKRQLKNKRACASNCTLTSTSLSLHKTGSNWPVLHKLMPETLRFPQSRGSGYCSTQSRICSPLRSLPQSVKLEYSRSAPVLQVFPTHTTHTKFQQLKYRLCVLLNHAVLVLHPFHEVTPRIRNKSDCIERKVERRITCSLQRMIKQSDSPCLLQSTCGVCVNSLIPLVCSSCACSRDNVSV